MFAGLSIYLEKQLCDSKPYSRKFPRAQILVIFVNYEVIMKIFITEI